jgi:4-hydroxy-tetrahydrodipicolinate reductase
MTEPIRLAVIGDGKMGRALASLAPEHGFDVVALLGEPQVLPGGITKALLNGADVAIEFTVPAAAAANVRGCIAAGCPVVSGTTGWDAERASVEADVRARDGTFLWAPNFSIGVALFARIVEDAVRLVARVGAGFDAHIVETHHKAKLDAPSGTARLLASRAAVSTRSSWTRRSSRSASRTSHAIAGSSPPAPSWRRDGSRESVACSHSITCWRTRNDRSAPHRMRDRARHPLRGRRAG